MNMSAAITAWDDPARDAATDDDYRWQAEQENEMHEGEIARTANRAMSSAITSPPHTLRTIQDVRNSKTRETIQRARDELDALAYHAYDRLDQANLDRISRANTILAELQKELAQ